VIPDLDLRRPGVVDGAAVATQVERFGVTRIAASPAFFERLVAYAQGTGRPLTKLRKLYTGGAPVFPRLLETLRTVAPNARITAVYGSTEAEPIAHVDANELSADDVAAMQAGRGLLAGTPVAEIQLRIVRDHWGAPRGKMTAAEFAHEVLLVGEVGEIVVSGEHVLSGYLRGVGDAETKFSVDGIIWHRTGDAGMLDERGRLWLQGSCAARIDDAYGRLYPFAVECVAMTLDEVRRAAVVAHGGERWLIVEASCAREGESLQQSLRAATAWAHIERIQFMDAIPVDRRHNAKIDYSALRRRLASD
jgi:acyl-CoA synthetase (AMP-forming)/AMP-acid ligase II